jgi:hypothetical protein
MSKLRMPALLTLLVASAMLAAAMPDRDRSPEGAWIGTAVTTNPPGMPPFPSTDVYYSSTSHPGRSGTVLCTIPGSGRFPVYVGGQLAYSVRPLPVGSGTWLRTGRGSFAVTVWRLLVNADTGAPAGLGKFWGRGRVLETGQLSVAMRVQYFDIGGEAISPVMEAEVTEHRIAVDPGLLAAAEPEEDPAQP